MCNPGTVAEALAAVRAGVDGLVAQGVEAGGHVRGETSTLALVPAIVDAVDPTPVLAAGGIADARGVSAALALGAQGGSAPVRHSSGMGSDSRCRARLETSSRWRCTPGKGSV